MARAAKRYPAVACACSTPWPSRPGAPAAAQALAEGIVLGAYRFTTYKSEPEPRPLERVVVVGGGGASGCARRSSVGASHRRGRRRSPATW